MANKGCYFKCKNKGQLFSFPRVTYNNYEKYYKWKEILRKEDKEKGDHYIMGHVKLCRNHFEDFYFTAHKRLTRHAVPTLKLGITKQQEELLCNLIKQNPTIIMECNSSQEMLKKFYTKLMMIEPQINALGLEKSYNDWAQYLFDVISSLKTKEVIWINKKCKNTKDFTELELTILDLWSKEMIAQDSPDLYDLDFKNKVFMESMLEDEDSDGSEDSWTSKISRITGVSGTSRVSRVSGLSVTSKVSRISGDSRTSKMSRISCDSGNSKVSGISGVSGPSKVSKISRFSGSSRGSETSNAIVTFTLNVASGGQKPLLQAADVEPYESTQQDYLNVKCKCKHFDSEVQDEFDDFGKDIAQQLRNMPRQTALETRQLLMSVLCSKQNNIFDD